MRTKANDNDGYMIVLPLEITVYPNKAISEIGVKDDKPIVVPIPKKGIK